jgi:hypothetical protein
MKLPTLHILTVADAGDERDDIVASYVDGATPDSKVLVHVDEERRGIMWNWLHTAEHALAYDDTKWSIIIQDDAAALPGWRTLLPEALWFSPAPILGMSHFGQITDTAHRAGVPYLVGPHLIWGAAVAYRRDFLEGLVPWARRVYEATGYPHDDRLVSAYANKIGVDTALTTRALFDQPVEKSTVGHGGQNRRPGHTILEPGAHYGVRPRARRKASGGAPEQREWLKDLFTPNEHPTHGFQVIRSGAVTWAAKETS